MNVERRLIGEVIYNITNVRESWCKLYSSTTNPSILSEYEYVRLWLSHFASEKSIVLFVAYDGGELVGVLPLIRTRRGPLRFLKSLTNAYSMVSNPLVVEKFAREFMNTLSRWLAQEQSQWDYLQYDGTYSFSQMPGLVDHEIGFPSGIEREYVMVPTFAAGLKDGYEALFRNGFKKKTRQNYQLALNRLKGYKSWKYVSFRGIEAIRYWEELVRLEDLGWKGEGNSSIAKLSINNQQYYQNLVKYLASRNALHLDFIEIDGKFIAGGFGYRDNEIFHYSKAGFDPEYGHISPSVLLMTMKMKDICDHYPGVNIFHLYPGDYGYKHRYSTLQEYSISLRMYKNIMGKGYHRMRGIKKRFKLVYMYLSKNYNDSTIIK